MDLPEHYYYSAGSVNRASAKEMSDHIYAGIRDRKREIADFLLLEHNIALQVASQVETSRLYQMTSKQLEIKVTSRDPERDALDVIGQHLLAFGQSLLVATSEGWLSNEQAGQQFRQAASAIGLDELEAPDEDVEALQNKAREQMDFRRPQLECCGTPLAVDGDPNWQRPRLKTVS